MDIWIILLTFFSVFIVNFIPIITPPTWTVLSIIAFNYPSAVPLPILVIAGIVAAFIGRFLLILSSGTIIRKGFLSKSSIQNINNLKKHLIKKKAIIYWTFFLEAITPLPSDHLFIAYGITRLKARYALIPFFIGRIFTYSFWVYTASFASRMVSVNPDIMSYLKGPFILIQILLIIFIYIFIKIDWSHLIIKKRFRFYGG